MEVADAEEEEVMVVDEVIIEIGFFITENLC